jgi:hypothetical protein
VRKDATQHRPPILQIRAVASLPPAEASQVPSGATANAATVSVWPVRVWRVTRWRQDATPSPRQASTPRWARPGRLRRRYRDALRAPWTHPPRREHPPPRGSSWKKNGQPTDYARTPTGPTRQNRIKAGLKVDCKSVASSRPLGRRSSTFRRRPQGRLRRRCALAQAPPLPPATRTSRAASTRGRGRSGRAEYVPKSGARDPIERRSPWPQPQANVLADTP